MSEKISPEIFAHLVDLASLDLSVSEAEYLRRELNQQLKSIDELIAIPLDADIPRTTHGVSMPDDARAPLRKDEWKPFEDIQAILAQAPETDEGAIVVPDIPHTDLE
jgi:aspartyl-tRNA(Asn)/glutamyl-tRNA(Gln) amidotransferase subunit C